MNLLKFLRYNSTPIRNVVNNSTLRGPKKKSDKKGEGIVSEHILNIFKSKDDVAILPSEYYPSWVNNFGGPIYRQSDYVINSACGNYVK